MTVPPMELEGSPFMPVSQGDEALETALASIDSELNYQGGVIPEDTVDINVESDHVLSATPLPDETEPLSVQDELGVPKDEDAEKAMEALYGSDFPLLKENPESDDWATWAVSLWKQHGPGMQARLHLVERNRLMRKGSQWLSERFGIWREPPKPRDAARSVDNMIAPALDQRIEIVADQRPGFRCKPENQEQRNLKKAESQQIAIEYQYDQQKMAKVIREAEYWAGTDGVSFLAPNWNPERGPWDEVLIPEQDGEEQVFVPRQMPLGDVETRVFRIEQVRVSAEATATVRPSYWIARETLPLAQAVREYGPSVVDADNKVADASDVAMNSLGNSHVKSGMLTPDVNDLLTDQKTVDRFTVYCEKSEYLPKGLTLVVVGRDTVAGPLPLLSGKVPLVRFTDGSTDPSFYPVAEMEKWIDSQMRVNALLSGAIDSVRLNRGGRLLAKENAISSETLIGGLLSVIGVKGAGNLQDNVQPFPSFSIGSDTQWLIEREKKCFEDLSGWSDTSRGSFESDTSGRAILAQREALEKIFAPVVNAASEAMAEWAEINISWMKWGYDYPRMVSVEGSGRPDLVRELKSDDFDGVANVTIDPETLMPMPRALRLFLLDSMLEKGVMSMQEYRRRLPFAFTQNIDTPDTDQQARAKRIAEAIRSGQPELPMLWMDNEAIHQDVLERELILPDDLPPEIRGQAYQRWMMLAQQAQMKAGGMVQQTPGGGGKSPQLPAGSQPLQGTNPGVAAGTASMMKGESDEQRAGVQADALSKQ